MSNGQVSISDYFYNLGETLIKSSRSSWPVVEIKDKNGKTRMVRVNPNKLKEKPETERQAKQRAKSTSDADIIANVVAGSRAAQSDLYAKYNQDVFKVIHTFVQDIEIAKDLTSNTFVKVFTKMDDYLKHSATLPFKNWLVRIASNTARDYLRSAHAAIQQNAISEEAKQAHFNSASRAANPEQEMETTEIAEQVHAALKTLPKEYASAIADFYFNGLSVKEIAKKYNISESGVSQRLARGKQALKRVLSPSLYKALEPEFEVLESIYEINLDK
jgi:RNA polymerase sigma-70 factor (ECF subfamily)